MDGINEIKISKRKLEALFNDNVKSAEAINLTYVNDSEPGITRNNEGTEIIYLQDRKPVKDRKTLNRIKSLVIPPAWREVWICRKDNGHLQATGLDAKNRKQYKYHPLWNSLRNYTKFTHLYDFGKALPIMRSRVQQDLKKHGLPLEKVLATTVSVMENTCIRIGNGQYEKLYGSFGLTTMKDKHVSIKGETVEFTFVGKKGVHQDIGLKSKRLANIIKRCRDIPGKELFQYYDEEGWRHQIDSGMVNDYIREISGGQFTAKDFRTWAGTLSAIEAFRQFEPCESETEIKKNVVAALDAVAKQLGNTRNVCKKYYVHPAVIDHYTNHSLEKYLAAAGRLDCSDPLGLTCEEQAMMNILAGTGVTSIAA
jgi:DNA topoisomerase-1